MPNFTGKCCNIRRIVRLRQLLRRWRHKTAAAARKPTLKIPSDVPKGHVAVNVGSDSRRFVVRATFLNHPVFQKLLAQAEESYGGFTNSNGPLTIPCDESVFEEILRFISRSRNSSTPSSSLVNLEDFQTHCHLDFLPESRPLLAEKSVR